MLILKGCAHFLPCNNLSQTESASVCIIDNKYLLFLVNEIQIVMLILPRISPTFENSFVYGFESPRSCECVTFRFDYLYDVWLLHKVFAEELNHWLVVVEWFRSQICLTQLGTHEDFVWR